MYKYKCTECAQEYDELPQYCDCGNDSFDVIENENSAQSSTTQYSDLPPDNSVQKSGVHRKNDFLSILVFVICIILSVFILFFAGNSLLNKDNSKASPGKEIKEISEKTDDNSVKNIPSIDELWSENKVKTESTAKKDEQIKISPAPESKAAAPVNTVSNKTVSPVQKISKNTTNTVKKDSSSPAKKVIQKPVSKQIKTVENKKAPSSTSSTGIIQKAATTKADAAAQKQALLNYKIALRNKIASNINFAAIIGDGYCVISFKISQSGKLVERAFSKQSTNDSLNDAVYNAIMQTPAYNPPPAAYKNETLKLSVKMYGGNFEVDLN